MAYHQLVERQRKTYQSGATLDVKQRKERLRTLKNLLECEKSTLTQAVYKDLRRRPEVTEAFEIANAIVEIDYVIEYLDEWTSPIYVERTFLTFLDTPMVVKDPLGVVLIMAPWNYPLNLILMGLISAIAAGNTAIIKPSELSSHTADALEELFNGYFDPKFVAVAKGGVTETTELLKERFDHILFTGSAPVAKIIMTAAAKHLTPVTFELGGKCPVVVEEDADIEISAKRIAWGKWLNCGQTCLAPDYLLVTAEVKPKLVAAICEAVREFYGENVRDSEDYSRIVNGNHFDRLASLIGKSKGEVLLKAGELDKSDLFIPPMVLDVEEDDILMKEEIFGPALPIITINDLDDAIGFIKAGEKPLAAYIFTKSEEKVKHFYETTSSGAVCVNDVVVHLSVDTLPFGGVGYSGMGRYKGKYGFDTFTHEKAVLKRAFFSDRITASRYPPGSPEKFERLKQLTGTRRAAPIWCKKYFPFPLILFGLLWGFLLQRFGLR